MNKPGNNTDSLLVGAGKSKRLQEMRDKAKAANLAAAPAPPPIKTRESAQNISPELALARQLIDQKLTAILASLPAGKQQSLFKIRFGISLAQIKQLPIKRVISLLQISDPQLNNLSASMKRIIDLNYNGEFAD